MKKEEEEKPKTQLLSFFTYKKNKKNKPRTSSEGRTRVCVRVRVCACVTGVSSCQLRGAPLRSHLQRLRASLTRLEDGLDIRGKPHTHTHTHTITTSSVSKQDKSCYKHSHLQKKNKTKTSSPPPFPFPLTSSLCMRPKLALHSKLRVPGNNSAATAPPTAHVAYGCSCTAYDAGYVDVSMISSSYFSFARLQKPFFFL